MIFIAISLPLVASGWSIGAEAGYAYTMVKTATGWDNTQNLSSHGFDISIPVSYEISDWFSVNTGLRYIMKNTRYIKTAVSQDPGYPDVMVTIDDYMKGHHFLEIPVTLRFAYKNNGFGCFAGIEGYVGARILETRTGRSLLSNNVPSPASELYRYNTAIVFTKGDNLFDAGLIAELGASYKLGPGDLYLIGRYQYGPTSLVNDMVMMTAHISG